MSQTKSTENQQRKLRFRDIDPETASNTVEDPEAQKIKKPRKTKGNKQRIDQELEYEVDKILDEKLFSGKKKYLVSWQGYKETENTWEPIENLKNCLELVKNFSSQREKIDLNKGDDTDISNINSQNKSPTKSVKQSQIQQVDEKQKVSQAPRKSLRNKKKEPVIIEETLEENNQKGQNIDGTYEVEKIVDDRDEDGQHFYLIKWKNYPDSVNTWEPESNLNCKEILNEYLKKKQNLNTSIEQREIENLSQQQQTTPKKQSRRKSISKFQSNNEKSPLRVVPVLEEGRFERGNRVLRILGSQDMQNSGQWFKVIWRPEGDIDYLDSLVTYEELKFHQPELLCDYLNLITYKVPLPINRIQQNDPSF